MEKTKKIDLFINVSQNLKGRSCDKFELFTTGKLKKKKGQYVVEYENEYNGISKIFLKENGSANIVTKGDIFYILKLDENKETKFNCNTKDTFSNFSVNTKNIFYEINEDGGKIEFLYDLLIDNTGGMLENKVNIRLK